MLKPRELAEKRLATAEGEGVTEGYYTYVGLTSDEKQIVEAVEVADSNPKVVGIKMFAGKSVGSLQVLKEEEQRNAYKRLSELGYTDVLAVHCEKDSMAKMELWDPRNPKTWNDARPAEMELASLKDQIRFAKEQDFKGTLHICHISNPDSVLEVDAARNELKITCGATPHHLQYSTSDMNGLEGLRYKVNPPLRDPTMSSRLFSLLKEGKIDWIETDHAPHSQQEKSYVEGKETMSGMPSLASYAEFLRHLSKNGFTGKQVADLTYNNIKRVFTKVEE